MKIISKGESFIATSGEYDMFGIIAYFIALQDFEPDKAMDEFLESTKYEVKGFFTDDQYAFLNWLCNQGICEEVDMVEMHIGNYSIYNDGIKIYQRPKLKERCHRQCENS